MATRWLRRPQQVWFRRALFQIHLWLGLALGLYVVVLSVSGSVLVYRIELNTYVSAPRAMLREGVKPMTADQIRDAAARAYPGWTVTGVFEGRYTTRGGRGRGGGEGYGRRPPDPTASVDLERGGEKKDRLF
ncbi:MAG TPA: PepSY domain-containing protein, partial [Vicinamibacterales bacterium]